MEIRKRKNGRAKLPLELKLDLIAIVCNIITLISVVMIVLTHC